MFPSWVVPILLLCVIAVFVYIYAASRRRTHDVGEKRKPKAIRRGKYMNK